MFRVWVLFAAAACRPAPEALPQASAPGAVLLASQSAFGDVTIEATVRADTLRVDVDTAADQREGFAWRVLDANGESLWERSTNGPVLVREFLGFYSKQAGVDVLGSLPKLGNFAVPIPLLDAGVSVDFRRRGEDGAWVDAGRFDLGALDALDQGLSEVVVDHATLVGPEPAPGEREYLDVVVVGDGYAAADQPKWLADAQSVTDRLMGTEPFATYAAGIRVHRVDAVSAESGASYDCETCANVDNAFGSMFPLEAVNRLTGSTYDARAIVQTEQHEVARAVSVVPWDVVIVVVNTEQFGGMAVHWATVTTADRSDLWEDTAVHEFGHALGLLGDEYVFDSCIRSDALGLPANISEDPTDPPWQAWVETATRLPTASLASNRDVVGTFKGAYNCEDLYRPMLDCKMRESALGPFCPVCTEALIRRMTRFTDPIDVTLDGRDAVATSDWPGVRVSWLVDGRLAATTGVDEVFHLPARGRVEAHGEVETEAVRWDPEGDLVDMHVVRP